MNVKCDFCKGNCNKLGFRVTAEVKAIGSESSRVIFPHPEIVYYNLCLKCYDELVQFYDDRLKRYSLTDKGMKYEG